MPADPTISLTAHAKVNLALSVGPPLPQGEPHAGMHPVASWMHAIALGDDIEITLDDHHTGDRFDITWADDTPTGKPIDWALDDDLAVRAVRAMRARELLRDHAVRLRVRKRVPAGGGLGGGSGDAGAVLCALAELIERASGEPIRQAALHEIAATLGSDVTFFVDRGAPAGRPRPALVGGLGEIERRLQRRSLALTLVCPPFGCPTGAVYRAYDASPGHLRIAAVEAASAARPIDPDLLFNDLQAPACLVQPGLEAVLAALADAGVPAMVSGSGSTVLAFGRLPAPASGVLIELGCRLLPTGLV